MSNPSPVLLTIPRDQQRRPARSDRCGAAKAREPSCPRRRLRAASSQRHPRHDRREFACLAHVAPLSSRISSKGKPSLPFRSKSAHFDFALPGIFTSASPNHPAIAASSSRSASVASAGACGWRSIAWTKGRLACRSALRSTRRDEAIAQEEWQDVIAVRPLLRRRVDLDAIAEAEQPLGAGALPDKRIERREQRPCPDPAGSRGVAVEIGAAPAVDRDRDQQAILDQLRAPRSRVPARSSRK